MKRRYVVITIIILILLVITFAIYRTRQNNFQTILPVTQTPIISPIQTNDDYNHYIDNEEIFSVIYPKNTVVTTIDPIDDSLIFSLSKKEGINNPDSFQPYIKITKYLAYVSDDDNVMSWLHNRSYTDKRISRDVNEEEKQGKWYRNVNDIKECKYQLHVYICFISDGGPSSVEHHYLFIENYHVFDISFWEPGSATTSILNEYNKFLNFILNNFQILPITKTDGTLKWKTYIDYQLNAKVNVPIDWKIVPFDESGMVTTLLGSSSGGDLELSLFQKSAKDYRAEADTSGIKSIIEHKKIMINDRSYERRIITREVRGDFPLKYSLEYLMDKSPSPLTIVVNTSIDYQIHLPIIEKIIASIKFLQ